MRSAVSAGQPRSRSSTARWRSTSTQAARARRVARPRTRRARAPPHASARCARSLFRRGDQALPQTSGSPFVVVVYTKVRRRSPIGSPPSGGFPDPEVGVRSDQRGPGRGSGRDAKTGRPSAAPSRFSWKLRAIRSASASVNRPSIRISSGPCCQSRTSSASRTRSSRIEIVRGEVDEVPRAA